MFPVQVAQRTSYIQVEAECTGSLFRLFDITLDTVFDAFELNRRVRSPVTTGLTKVWLRLTSSLAQGHQSSVHR